LLSIVNVLINSGSFSQIVFAQDNTKLMK